MTDGLKDEHREAIIAAIAANDRVERAVLFGSRATGTNTVSSDVDIALFGDRLTLTDQARLAATLEELPIPQSVDLLVYDSIQSPSLREHIRKQGIECYTRSNGPASRRATSWFEPSERWAVMPFTDAFLVNPTVPIERDLPTPFVDMAAVDPSVRSVQPKEVRKFRGSGSRFQDGDTLMARITPCLENGKIARYSANSSHDVGHGSTEFIVIRGLPEVTDSEYAFYVTRSGLVRGYAIDQMTGTSGRQRVPAESLAHLDVSVPPLVEQRAIARFLGTLDDKIELNRRMSATLEAMARALFKSWLVDFDPVRAKMKGCDAGLPNHIAELFPCRLIESVVGNVPIGWDVVPLSHIIDVNPTRRLRKGQMAPYLDMANMPTTGHTPHDVTDRPFGSGMRFTNGDTLVARITPCLENGKTAYVDFLQPGSIGWGSTEYLVMRPKPPLPTQFAYCLARSAHFRSFLIRNMSGTSGRQRVPAPALSQFMCINPPEYVAQVFAEIVQPLMCRASVAARESRRLSTIRDSLLPRLLAGELRINRFMEETA